MDVIVWVLKHVPEFIIIISVVITVHELGHYWVGRLFGAAIESFSIGFGRPIFERKDKRGTRWRVNWIPLGGFVKFVGEVQAPQDTQEVIAGPVGKPYTEFGPWKRIAVSLGGPFANFVFAIAVFAGMGMTLGVAQAKDVFVSGVVANSPAAAAGFAAGDRLVQAGSRAVKTNDDVTMATQLNAGEKVTYKVERKGEIVTLVATPVEQVDVDNPLRIKQSVGRIGLALEQRDA